MVKIAATIRCDSLPEMSPSDPPQSVARPASWSRHRKRSELIARDIVADMARRGLEPGQTLPNESEMLAQFKVGRASLREALRILEVQGIVRLKPGPGGGPVVTARRVEEFADMLTLQLQVREVPYRELFEARAEFEPIMARMAAQRRELSAASLLTWHLDATAQVPNDRFDVLAAAWGEFHNLVASLSGNGALCMLSSSLQAVYQTKVVGRELASGRVVTDELRATNDGDHRAIAEAIIAGDADLAEHLMRVHMYHFTSRIAALHGGLIDEVIAWE